MKELIDPQQAENLMRVAILAAPIIGAVCGTLSKNLVRGTLIGLALGLANYGLWRVYNVITDSLGLDTVKNLLVNLGLFLVIGVVVGLIIRRFSKPEADPGG